MESDTFNVDFMVKLMWRFSGNLICLVFSMTNFTIKSPQKFSLSPY